MMDYEEPIRERERVEIYLSCSDLKCGKVKSYAVIHYAEKNEKFKIYGETETISDSANPSFTKPIMLEYRFEQRQDIGIELFNARSKEKIGETAFMLGKLIASPNQTFTHDLFVPGTKSTIGKCTFRFEVMDLGSSDGKILRASATSLYDPSSKGFLCFGSRGTCNPVLRFYREGENGTWTRTHETNHVNKNRDPRWSPFFTSEGKLCSGTQRKIRIEAISKDKGSERLIGECVFSYSDLKLDSAQKFKLKNDAKRIQEAGTVEITLQSEIKFSSYLKAGLKFNTIVGVDFTETNKTQKLHNISDLAQNEYQKTLKNVCDILLNYDPNRRIHMHGFGGVPNYPNYKKPSVSHCFPCTGNQDAEMVTDLKELMKAYQFAVDNVTPLGPRHFSEIVAKAMETAKTSKQKGSKEYTILLMITDGIPDDIDETLDLMVQSSYLPLSIIIVGVGVANFGKMAQFDGNQLISKKGYRPERKLVQFVPFSKFKANPEELASEVLREIPDQFLQYMLSQRLTPEELQGEGVIPSKNNAKSNEKELVIKTTTSERMNQI